MSDAGIALFGGSFNPIHHGHLIVARAVAEHLGVSRLVLVPSAAPPHKHGQDLAPAQDRLAMARLAVEGDAGFDVSDAEIRRSGPSYTFLTVEDYRRAIGPDTPLYWLIGADTLPELHTWYRIGELTERCRIVTAVRPGYEHVDLSLLSRVLPEDCVGRLMEAILPTPRIDISATDIRDRVCTGRSIRFLVPETVREYIEQRGLYRQGSKTAFLETEGVR
jgi:nicotinate-nucleotide adenylyltransferase